MEETLFTLPEDKPKSYVSDPPLLTRQERQAKINSRPKLNTITGDNQKDTSRQAAIEALPRMQGIKQQIVDMLGSRDEGLTCSEFCEITGREKPSCSPRFVELEHKGIIRADGVRATNRGREATVYKLVEYR